DRNGDDQHRAEMQQKDDVHQGDDNGLLDQCVLERGHGSLDEARAIVERHDRHPAWEPRLNRLQFLFHLVDDVDRADSIAHHHDPTHSFVAPFDQGTGPEGIADLHLGYLAHEDGNAILGAHHDVLDVAEARNEPQATHHRPGAAGLHDIATDITITAHHGIRHGGQRDVEGAQPVRVHIDLILPHHPPDAGHFGHTWYGVKLIADKPVLK